MNFVLQTRKCVGIVFLIHKKMCIKNEELCIKKEEFCIKNDGFCSRQKLKGNRAIWAAEFMDGLTLEAMSMSATVAEAVVSDSFSIYTPFYSIFTPSVHHLCSISSPRLLIHLLCLLFIYFVLHVYSTVLHPCFTVAPRLLEFTQLVYFAAGRCG